MPRMKLWMVVAVVFSVLCPAVACGGWHDGVFNQLGRCLGIGWSDGYHARHLCPQFCCGVPQECGWGTACASAPCGTACASAPCGTENQSPVSASPPASYDPPTPTMAPPPNSQTRAAPVIPFSPIRGVQLPPALPGYGGNHVPPTANAAPMPRYTAVPPAYNAGPRANYYPAVYAPYGSAPRP